MATPTTSVRKYCTLLAESRLLPPDEVESLHKRWRDETQGSDEDVEQFRKFLVARRCLTEWQGHMVQRGRSDGFFLDGYKILDRIGKGQMGGVYKAVHTLGQIVAVKILPASRAKNPHVLGRFQREARLLTQLDHPNVVRAFQVGEANGINYIAMEYLEGETLDEVLERRKRLPWGEAVRLVHQALGGLQHLHEKRMIHRDLKPANLMLTPAPGKNEPTWNATVRILDIGLGRELFDDSTPEGQIETQLTVEGSVLGTPDYLAPEQAKDARTADIRADIYSVGCVLYHCLVGHPPFPETNIMTQMLKHATEKPRPLSAFLTDAPPGLQVILDRLLAKTPDERYSTPAEAAAALKPYLGTVGVAPAGASVVPAFKAWLESESQLELPRPPLPSPGVPAKPAPPPLPAAPVAAAPAKPVAPVVARPPTNPAPAITSTPRPVAVPPRPAPVPAPGVPVRPQPPVRPAPPPPAEEEVSVELVMEPVPGPELYPAPVIVPPPAVRKLWDLDRRDWIMLAAGAAGVLTAVGVGYALARAVRKRPEPPPTDEE